MKKALSTNFILCINTLSETDKKQISCLCNKFLGAEIFDEGLHQLQDNIIVWTYAAEAYSHKISQAHNSQEWEAMFWPIYRLRDYWSCTHNREFSDWNEEYKNYGRFWYEHWKYENIVKGFKRHIRAFNAGCFPSKAIDCYISQVIIEDCHKDKWKHYKFEYKFHPKTLYCLGIANSNIFSVDGIITFVARDMMADKVIVECEITNPYSAINFFTNEDVSEIEYRLYPTKLGQYANSNDITIWGISIWELL